MRYFHTLTFRVLVGSCVLLIVLFWLYTSFAVNFHENQMMDQVLDSALKVSHIIKNSTRYSMMQGRNKDAYEIMKTIGQEPGVEGISIYNKRGKIMFSTNPSDVGRVVDMHAEACDICHDGAQPLQSVPNQ